MNSLDAARYLMRAYPGGADALAPRLDKTPTTLRHEVAGSDKYKLGVVDAQEMTLMAMEARVPNALAILHSMAANCGAMVVALPDMHAVAGATFEDLAACAKEFAEFVSVAASAAADGKVTGNELRDIDRELSQMVACVHRVRNGLAAQHEAEAARQTAPTTTSRGPLESVA